MRLSLQRVATESVYTLGMATQNCEGVSLGSAVKISWYQRQFYCKTYIELVKIPEITEMKEIFTQPVTVPYLWLWKNMLV